MSVGKRLKQMRGRSTQQQLSLDLNVSRETVSAYETERARIPEDISQALMNKYDDPFYAMEVASQYTGGAWAHELDGPAVDLHRTSVQLKTEEELDEALEAIKAVCLANKPDYLQAFERDKLEKSIMEGMDAVIALNHFIAISCKEYRFSWTKMWLKHKAKLVAKGLLRKTSV